MPRRHKYVSEYKENFKPHKVQLPLERNEQLQNQVQRPVTKLIDKENGRILDVGPKVNVEETKKMEIPALRYKAGLAPKTTTKDRLRYKSEYQKQFEWKRPLEREAPILSAEKMIYGGQDGNPSRATKVTLPKKTEYQLQFVKHPVITSPVKELGKDQDKPLPIYSPKGYQDGQIPAGVPSKKVPPPNVPQQSMVFQSEYRANFKSPLKYDYVKGAWIGADPPQLHPPDEKSDSDVHLNNAWYHQVLELREKVHKYRSRAREGSYFLSLLEDLKKYERREPTPKHDKPVDSNTQEPNKPETPASEPSKVSTPVKQRPVDYTKTEQRPDDQPRIDDKHPDKQKKNNQQIGNEKRSDVKKAGGVGCVTKPVPVGQSGVKGDKEGTLFWDKAHNIPGPRLKKAHSLETLSNDSTISNESSRNIPDQPPLLSRVEAWGEKRPADHTHVIPPYHTIESCDGDDTCSDVTISELSDGDDDQRGASYREQPINQATRKLFTGKRLDDRHSSGGGDRNDIGVTRKIVGDDRKFFFNSRDANDSFQIVGDNREDRLKYVGDGRQSIGDDRGYGDDNRKDIVDNRKRMSSYSSDDERSSSVTSQSSSILSVEAMHKRRELASETLQRAKRRQAQL